MAIPESQLETWAKQGAITTAKSTADSVKNALNSYNNWPNGIDFEVYLQGSYKNDTNIRGDSDVDIVAQLNSTFYSNLSVLSIVVDYSLCRASILPCFCHYIYLAGSRRVGLSPRG
ncbi:MAG TPA: nucleotidyltransferase [Anaerohalosphaeraceae bacterium]|nr:nucleotidyltransferase [Anaerohalosphaeraceae bacterium]HOL32263.1 nucleotidyltransferase [Anaerohalosphaeraceae bacterium]HOM75979.1 nucleotidyltransferase [Anaerohalosphaeraceae bacterium]HPO69845.1 nucleotidyltransferase [Anaerohalosphaeraceae bacterium]HRS72270.1 nucleotidyltransferase [Anaerohalosphaeraceae bacterium]